MLDRWTQPTGSRSPPTSRMEAFRGRGSIVARAVAGARVADTDAKERIAFADAALALAGHQVTDPAVRDLMERVARDEMTGDQAVAALRRLIQG